MRLVLTIALSALLVVSVVDAAEKCSGINYRSYYYYNSANKGNPRGRGGPLPTSGSLTPGSDNLMGWANAMTAAWNYAAQSNTPGYCSAESVPVEDYANTNNRALCPTGGKTKGMNKNIAYGFDINFVEPDEGYEWCWQFRLDFGRGGVVYANGALATVYTNTDYSVNYMLGSKAGTSSTCSGGWCGYVNAGCFAFPKGMNNFTINVFEDCCDGPMKFQYQRHPVGSRPTGTAFDTAWRYLSASDLQEIASNTDPGRGGRRCTKEVGASAPIEPRTYTAVQSCLGNAGGSATYITVAEGVDNQEFRLPFAMNYPEDSSDTIGVFNFYVTNPNPHQVPVINFLPTKVTLHFDGLRFSVADRLRWKLTSPSGAVATVSGPPCTNIVSMGAKRIYDHSYSWLKDNLKHDLYGADYSWTYPGGVDVTRAECPQTDYTLITQKSISMEAMNSVIGTPAQGMWSLKMWIKTNDGGNAVGYFNTVRLVLLEKEVRKETYIGYKQGLSPPGSSIRNINTGDSNILDDANDLLAIHMNGKNQGMRMNPGRLEIGTGWYNTTTYQMNVPAGTAGKKIVVEYEAEYNCRPENNFTVDIDICDAPPTPSDLVLVSTSSSGATIKWNAGYGTNEATATYETRLQIMVSIDVNDVACTTNSNCAWIDIEGQATTVLDSTTGLRSLLVQDELFAASEYKMRLRNFQRTAGCASSVYSNPSNELTFKTCRRHCDACSVDQTCSVCDDTFRPATSSDTGFVAGKECVAINGKCTPTSNPAGANDYQYAKYPETCSACTPVCTDCAPCPVSEERLGCFDSAPGLCNRCIQDHFKSWAGSISAVSSVCSSPPCRACLPCSICDLATEYEAGPCSAGADRICLPCWANSLPNEFGTSCVCEPGFGPHLDANDRPACTACPTGCSVCTIPDGGDSSGAICTQCKNEPPIIYALHSDAQGTCGATCTNGGTECAPSCPGDSGVSPAALADSLVCKICEQCAPGQERASCDGPCETCDDGSYKDASSSSWNATCAPCTTCATPYYAQTVCSSTNNAVCQHCGETPCGTGLIRIGCGGNTEGTCVPCDPFHFKKNETHCEPCALCAPGKRATAGCSGSSDTDLNTCVDCTICTPWTEHASTACQEDGDPSQNAICASCAACTGTKYPAGCGEGPGGTGPGFCVDCPADFYAHIDPTAGTSCRPCTTCLSETYARSDAQCGGHTNGPGDSADRVCLACPTMSRTAENNSVAIDSCICESGYANIPSGPGAFTCVECGTADCDQCGPQDTCTKCKAGLTLKDNTCSVITSCGAGYFMFNSSCVECTVCSDLSPLMVTKTGCTESEDTQCGYNTAAAQMLMSPEMEEERAGIMAGLIIAMIAGALLLVALIAGALVAVVFIRKLQARNQSLEGLALDNLSMGVDVSDNNVSAVMGEAVEMPTSASKMGSGMGSNPMALRMGAGNF